MASTVLDVHPHHGVSTLLGGSRRPRNRWAAAQRFRGRRCHPLHLRAAAYDELSSHRGRGALKRADDFPGIYTCTEEDRLDSIFDTILKVSRASADCYRRRHSHLKGIISLSDVLKYAARVRRGGGEGLREREHSGVMAGFSDDAMTGKGSHSVTGELMAGGWCFLGLGCYLTFAFREAQ